MRVDAAAAPTANTPTALPPHMRLRSIDLLRGLVIVLMVLDHVRDQMHISGFVIDPLDPYQTTPLLYVTRWITHFCAPTFVFLAGVSAWLQAAKGKPAATLSGFLLKRGLWLIFLEMTVVSFGWSFVIPFFLFLQVIWAIGWAMVALAALIWLPRKAVLAIGIAIIAGHNLFDSVTPDQLGGFGWLWAFLKTGGPWIIGGQPVAMMLYPVLPWTGVMALGYGMAPIFLSPRRDRMLVMIGIAMIAAFLLLRALNVYGDPKPWMIEPTSIATIMRFFDVEKYPPSLLYVCATLGPMLLLVPLLERATGAFPRVLQVFGAVPLFAYVVHVYLTHALAIAAHAGFGRPVGKLFNFLTSAMFDPQSLVPEVGLPLWVSYLGWIVTLILLYPCCRWWAGVKARRRDWWLSYM
jgi:uncharacterized membrane protein